MFTDNFANIRQRPAIYIAIAKKCLALLYFRNPFLTDNSGAEFHAD